MKTQKGMFRLGEEVGLNDSSRDSELNVKHLDYKLQDYTYDQTL